jgi:hypothetical protein
MTTGAARHVEPARKAQANDPVTAGTRIAARRDRRSIG